MPITSNDSASLFPAKGDLDTDRNEMNREPRETRPLSLKNTDNKTVTSVVNRSFLSSVAASTHESQRGFVPGRQLVQNVVDLDFHSRVFALQAYDHNATEDARKLMQSSHFLISQHLFLSAAHAWFFLLSSMRQLVFKLRSKSVFF